MRINIVLLAFAIAVVAAIGLLATNLTYAEQASRNQATVISPFGEPPATIELVRGRGGGRFHGGRAFRGGHGFRGRHFGPHFYGGWVGPYYGYRYYREPSCLDLTWDSYLNRWVCNVWY